MRRAGILTGGVVVLLLLAVVCTPPPAEAVKLDMTGHRFTDLSITISSGLTGPPDMVDIKPAFSGTSAANC